jgi:AAA+ superfamily predicted ATPase
MEDIKPYVYKPELREKLILSGDHTDLIDALTADMDVLMEDVISGKSGGTTILCQGKAGTGKTLTAEIYAEVIKRPLYRVHSGQLGTNAGTVEEALKKALENASRWRAVLLIDEADVFISQRGDDLEKNAVIGVFLRVLEYYSGLLFLTTNRSDTIDEAILSRCIAQIKYDVPGEEERVKLWLVLGDVYGLPLVKDKAMATKLAKEFPTATGRDIKGLIKLVTKYARQRNKKASIEDFKRMAAFKGL